MARPAGSANPPVRALAPPGNAQDDDGVLRLADPVDDPEVTDPQAPERAPRKGYRTRWPGIAREGEDRAAHAGCRVRRQLAELALGQRCQVHPPG